MSEILYKNYTDYTDTYWPYEITQRTSNKYFFEFTTKKPSIPASNLKQQYIDSGDTLYNFVDDSNWNPGRFESGNSFVKGFALLLCLNDYPTNDDDDIWNEAFVNQNEIVLPQEIGQTVSGELTPMSLDPEISEPVVS